MFSIRVLRKVSYKVKMCNVYYKCCFKNYFHNCVISSTSSRSCSDKIIDYDESTEPFIPIYNINRDETLERRKARLLYQSRKRGMLENDLLLSTFADKYLKDMSAEQTLLYDHLINVPSNDWDIFYWAVGRKPTPPEYDNEIMNLFKKHVENKERVPRLRQPDLH